MYVALYLQISFVNYETVCLKINFCHANIIFIQAPNFSSNFQCSLCIVNFQCKLRIVNFQFMTFGAFKIKSNNNLTVIVQT